MSNLSNKIARRLGKEASEESGALLPALVRKKRDNLPQKNENRLPVSGTLEEAPVLKARPEEQKLLPEGSSPKKSEAEVEATSSAKPATKGQRAALASSFLGIGGLGAYGMYKAAENDKDLQEETVAQLAPEEPEDEEVAKTVAQAVAVGSKDPESDKTISDLEKLVSGLAAYIPDEEERTDWEAKLAETRRLHEAREKELQDAEFRSTIIKSLVQLAASAYGLKTGLGIGKVPFDKQDWERKFDRNLGRYKEEADQVNTLQRAEESQIQNKLRRRDAARADRLRIALERLRAAREDKRAAEKGDLAREIAGIKKETKTAGDTKKDLERKNKALAEAQGLGNLIATGKSRDYETNYAKARNTLAKGGYSPQVLQMMDRMVLDEDGEVDEDKAATTFNNLPAILKVLEKQAQ